MDIREQVKEYATDHGLGTQKGRVGVVMDISASMRQLYENGTVQRVFDRLAAFGATFDDDGNIDVISFGLRTHDLGDVHESKIGGYVDRVVRQQQLEGGTRYAGPIEAFDKKYDTPGDPGFVIFVTDGQNQDLADAERAVIAASKHKLFFQFIGIGDPQGGFPFLEKLDEMSGRFVDNCGFAHIKDIDKMSDVDLVEAVLNEWPDWLKLTGPQGKGLWG